MGDNDDRGIPARHRGRTALQGRATDGRPYVVVLAVAPWAASMPPMTPAPAPTRVSTSPAR